MPSDQLTDLFEANRPRLRMVAYRMLGSTAEAEDAVQEAWLRLNRADTADVENLAGWLTTVVSRVCLDMLRSRKSRREDPWDVDFGSIAGAADDLPLDPEHEAVVADSVGTALLVVLQTLEPAERLAFVLHDLFAIPFDEIGPIVDRTPTAARQLASRARRRVQGASAAPDRARQREIVDAFLAASKGGDMAGLIALLDPNVQLHADATVVAFGSAALTRGPVAVAETFSGRARTAEPATIDGEPGLVWAQGGSPRVVFAFTIAGDKIVAIDLLADPDYLAEVEVTMLS